MIAVTYAMPEEKPRCELPDHATLIQTGIGKTLALTQLIRHMREQPLTMMIATGFCGGLNGTPQGAMVLPNETRQWDLFLTDLAIPLGHGYAMHAPIGLPEVELDSVPKPVRGRLITGDRFVDSSVHVSPDAVAVDMETAALAMLAAELKIPFVAVREVSDIADGPQELTHQQFLTTLRDRGPDYSNAIAELVARGPEGIPPPWKLDA